jgi:hypothetical protein
MKFSLLTSVSSAALGAGLLMSLPGAAYATLSCSPLVAGVSGSCSETDYTNNDTLAQVSQSKTVLGAVTIDDFVPSVIPGGGLQTLKSVTVLEGGNSKVTGTFQNTNSLTSESFTVDFLTKFSLGSTAKTPAGFPTSLKGQTDPTTTFTLTPGQTTHVSLPSNFTSSAQGFSGTVSSTFSSPLAGFIGSSGSTFSVDFSTAGAEGNRGGQNGLANFVSSAIGSITITYNYTTSYPAPEPASLAIVGAGLAGLGVLRRRRKA